MSGFASTSNRTATSGGDVMETEESPEFTTYCSFCVTQKVSFHQPIYVCNTCNSSANNNLCCCAGCATYCHAGHDVGFIAFGDAYCDCGEGKCGLFTKTVEEKTTIPPLPTSNPVLSAAKSLLLKEKVEDYKIEGIDYERALAEAIELVKHSKDTFWFPANESNPSCYLESLAKEIGLSHLQMRFGGLDPAVVESTLPLIGFEWWVQVKDLSVSRDTTNTSSEKATNNGVDLHYDKDESLAEDFGLGVFPTLSTVTYISPNTESKPALPTLILDVTAAAPVGAPIGDVYLSLPGPHKHLSFDGTLLHGAPRHLANFSAINHSSSPSGIEASTHSLSSNQPEYRITFLVNLWLGYQPLDVQRLPSTIARYLSSVGTTAAQSWPRVQLIPGYPGSQLKADVSVNMQITAPIEEGTDESTSNSSTVGSWYTLPFVSSQSQWGIDDDAEAALEVRLWLPDRQSWPRFVLHVQRQKRLEERARLMRQQQKKKKKASPGKKQTTTGAKKEEISKKRKADDEINVEGDEDAEADVEVESEDLLPVLPGESIAAFLNWFQPLLNV